MKKLLTGALATASAAVLSAPALAQTVPTPPDYTTLTAAADWSAVQTAIMTIGAGLAALYVVWVGMRMVLRVIRSA